MARDVVVPEVGELGMEVTLVRWLKREGEQVDVGDVLFEVDTAKAILEVEAYAAGTLVDISAREGTEVAPRQVVARIVEPGEAAGGSATQSNDETISAPGTASQEGGPSSSPSPPPGATTGSLGTTGGASPRARRLARELGVDIGSLAGTGPRGMVTESDVEAAAGQRLGEDPEGKEPSA
jgi:pyruvate dehydrogenase E2 component (dihydrolipoamide acetyltransferase)